MADPVPLTPAPTPTPAGPFAWFEQLPPMIRRACTAFVAVLLSTLAVFLAGLLKVPLKDIKEAVKEAREEEKKEAADAPVPASGWYADPDELAAGRASVPTVFRQTPAGAETDLPADVFQWQTYQKVTGAPPPNKDQGPVGSCVPHGGLTAYERSEACSIAAGERFTFTEFSEEASYALSRVDIGGGRLRGQDGSVGGWLAKSFTTLGALPAKKYATVDLTTYDPARCKRWGDTGMPEELKAEAAKFTAGDAANLRSWSDAKKALASGAGVFLCSRIGFGQQRDANGVCQPQGVWGHCTCLDGYHTENGKEYGHIQNSWGTYYHKGPLGWGSPPDGGFWAESRVIGQMIAEGDSWAVSAVKGFPRRQLDWTVDARPLRKPDRDPLGVFALAP